MKKQTFGVILLLAVGILSCAQTWADQSESTEITNICVGVDEHTCKMEGEATAQFFAGQVRKNAFPSWILAIKERFKETIDELALAYDEASEDEQVAKGRATASFERILEVDGRKEVLIGLVENMVDQYAESEMICYAGLNDSSKCSVLTLPVGMPYGYEKMVEVRTLPLANRVVNILIPSLASQLAADFCEEYKLGKKK